MKINVYLLLAVILLGPILIFCQTKEWRNLSALESSREEIEKILGKPRIYLDTFGIYDTAIGKFHIWYSKGGCHKEIEGLQYKIPAQRMTRLYFVPKKSLSLEDYISDKENYKKSESPFNDGKLLYISLDETIIYTTILPINGKEFVYTISIQPSKDRQDLLCKENEKK